MNRGYCRLCHGLIESEDYKAKIDELKESGVEGIVVNHIWNDGYLRDEAAWEKLNGIIDYAKSSGMNVWLYDERGYPSGKAGTYVVDSDPDFQAKGITYFMRDRLAGGEVFTFDLPDDLEKIIYVYLERNGERIPLPFEEKRVIFSDSQPHDSVHVFCEKRFNEGSVAASSSTDEKYVNIMDKQAMRRFIEVTYDAYYRHIPDFAAKIDAVFTDEPALAEGYIYREVTKNMWWSQGYKYACVSWCNDFAEEFKKDHGYDVLSCGRRLFRGDDEKSALTRINYRQTVARLTGEAFFSQIQSWCKAHGTMLSGHINNEEYIHEHVLYYGNLYTAFDKTGYIGMDILNGCIEELMYRDRRFIGNKFVGSLARIRGKTDTVMAELCPHRDKAFVNFTQIKAVASYLYFCGVNYVNSYWTAKDKEQSEEFSEYLHFLYDRLCGRAKHGKIAVYYPVETIQALVKPLFQPHEDIYRSKDHVVGRIEEGIRETAENLWAEGFDFEFVDAVALRDCAVLDGEFSVAGMRFSVLLMPGVKYLPKETYERVCALEKAGVKVRWLGEFNEVAVYGGGVSHVGVENLPYGTYRAAGETKNLIPWASDSRLLYAEFVRDGEVTGMFVNNDGAEKIVRFENAAAIETARFGKAPSRLQGNLTVAPYETLFVKTSK